MIPNMGELAIQINKWDIAQQRKNKWKQDRYEAMEYYKGNTKEFTSKYFSSSTLSKVVTGNVNVCKRVIDRISLVYMTPPKRLYTREDLPNFFVDKDLKLQRLERITNLLDGVLLKPCWRMGDDGGHIELMNMNTDNKLLRQKGQIIIFPSFVPWRVTKVTKCVRNCIEGWLHGPSYV